MSENVKEHILAAVSDDLTAIEKGLNDNLNPYLERVRDVAGHILFSGGKRMRPLLALLSARICGYRGDYAETFSVMFEYLHTATLLHDDLIDDGAYRRGKPVAHKVWDNPSAVLVGDFLLARASSIAAGTRQVEIFDILSRVMENLTQGELHQLTRKGDPNLTEDEYLQIIRNKTAVLMSGACRSGAVLAEATEEKRKALADYGMSLGMAFQMTDDLLDYTAETGQLGKAVGADLQEGKYTLPLIRALAAADANDAKTIKTIMAEHAVNQETLTRLNQLVEKYHGFDYTKKKAAREVDRAKEAVTVFPPSETRSLLMMLADYTIARSS